MNEFIIVILCTLVMSSALQLTKNKIEELIEKSIFKALEEDRPTKVRTVEKLEVKNGKCAVLDFNGIVEQYGYTAEEYTVTTVDGYILKIHRVSGSPLNPKVDGKPVVYIEHALTTDSDFYVFHGPDYDLVYSLADKGYDIWLGNVRGTSYSLSHVNYSHSDPEFWNFSMDEQSLIDTPTFMNFVLEQTGQEKLTFIGYSMGTTESFMLLSSKPEYNEKINLLICIAPVVIFDPPINSVLKTVINAVTETAEKLGIKEVLPQSCMIGKLGNTLCRLPEPNICSPLAEILTQANKINISSTFPTFLKYYPAGMCHYSAVHYKQMFESGKFQKFDFSYKSSDKSLNIEKYKQTEPPQYDLSLVTTPVVIFCSLNDIFVPIKNAKLLRKKLLNVVSFSIVPDKKFKHGDFFLHFKSKDWIFNPLMDIMSRQLSNVSNSYIQ